LLLSKSNARNYDGKDNGDNEFWRHREVAGRCCPPRAARYRYSDPPPGLIILGLSPDGRGRVLDFAPVSRASPGRLTEQPSTRALCPWAAAQGLYRRKLVLASFPPAAAQADFHGL
jgi:hypothetical protein